MALAFALSLILLAGLVIVASLPRSSLDLQKTEPRLRTFKEKELELELKVTMARRRALPEVTLDAVPQGLEAALDKTDEAFRLRVTSRFAGAYTGFRVRIGVVDPLGLFRRYETRELATAFEFLPTFLISGRRPVLVSAAMLGDYPAGRSGFGQEFYSAEAYTSSHGIKDIMWKRLAKSPSESPMARVGEANIPEKIHVALIERAMATSRNNPTWMNLASEALARVGVAAVSTGTTLRLLHVLGAQRTVREAHTLADLANLLMSLWLGDPHWRATLDEESQADIVVTGDQELVDSEVRELVGAKPSVILSFGQGKPVRGPNVMNFSGKEDISRLVVGVLSR